MKTGKKFNIVINHTVIPLLCLLFLTSCYREPFDVDVSQFASSIVIEGIVTDQEGPQTVKISRPGDISDSDNFPRVGGAAVSITENNQSTFSLQEVTEGVYQTYDLTGTPGRTYTLIVRIRNQTYTASCVMPEPVRLKEVKFEHIYENSELYEIACSFKDRPDTADYCLFNVYYNRHLIDYYLYQDDITDGEEIDLNNFNVLYGPGDQAIIEILTLDRIVYDFYYTLDVIVNNDYDEVSTTFIPMTTPNPTTNLDNGALGYFSAHPVSRYQLTAPSP